MRTVWAMKRLGEVCIIGDGNYSSKYPKAKEFVSTGIPFLTATNLKFGTIVSEDIRYISPAHHLKLQKGHIRKNDLVIVVRGSIGNNSIVPEQYDGSNLNSQLAFLRAKENVLDSKYLFLVFNSPEIQNIILNLISGSAQPQLPNNRLLNIKIPVPPISEQIKIVKKLDHKLELISNAKINTERNLQSAIGFSECVLRSFFKNGNNNWTEKKLGEICEYIKKPNTNANLPYIGLEDIQSNTGKLLTPAMPKKVKSTTFYFNKDFVLYGRLRPYLNKVLLPEFEGHCSTEIFPISPNKNILNRQFLYYWLISAETMNKINSTWTGATLPRANMNSVLEFKIKVPSLEDQQMIVQKLNLLSVKSGELTLIYKNKLKDLEELKLSILQKAFAGELIHTPELTTV